MPSKKRQFHFYADECIPIPSATFLREKGISVTHAADIDKVGKSDPYQLKLSRQINRIFLTIDNDFKQIDSISVNNHPGVILIKVTSPTPKNINLVLEKILKVLTTDFVKNSKVIISNAKVIRDKNGVITKKDI